MNKKLLEKYKTLRKRYPKKEYLFLFSNVPGLENLDQEIEEDAKKAKDAEISDLEGEYWNFSSFIFQKLKKKLIFKKWAKEQFDCQFGVCGICHKPMSNFHNARVEHIIPSRRYGSNYPDNLVLVHSNCKRKNGEDLDCTQEKARKNRFSERLDEYVTDLTTDIRDDYPVEFPDEVFKH